MGTRSFAQQVRQFAVGTLIVGSGMLARAGDLNPVTIKKAPRNAPVLLVENGVAKASICIVNTPPNREFGGALKELQSCLEATTGAKVPVVKGKIVDGPAIVLGDCPEAAALGLDGTQMPVEGFAIKTAENRVFIVGNDTKNPNSPGTTWGMYEFLERVVGVRWYWPTPSGGRSIIKRDTLTVDPMWIEDAPAFRQREIWPSPGPLGGLHSALRSNNSWPIKLVVHSPRDWGKIEEYRNNRPEVFQMRKDGSRDDLMLCYGNKRTLETYLEILERAFDKGEKIPGGQMGIIGNAITVSPWDADVVCYCPDCRNSWNEQGGQYGSASRTMGEFVAKLGREVKKRWPDKTVIFLPYLNYTLAPDGIEFPDNVEVQLCGMPGVAMYKEPSIKKEFQTNIDKWQRLTHRKVQTWDYSCWPEDRTKAPFQYPHVIKQYYQDNRNKFIGTFINGTQDHWPRQHVSLYCWMKIMWNPGYDVDAMMDEFCTRMFGPAAGAMRELLRLQTDCWEKSAWKTPTISPAAIYETSYPPKTVKRMLALLEQARAEAGDDALLQQRLAYYTTPFNDFLREYEFVVEGKGVRPLIAKKVGENPIIDGKLDDAVWQAAEPVMLMKYSGKDNSQIPVTFPTQVQAVWTREGVTFGLRMSEPNPGALQRELQTRDDGTLYWQDCIELYVDPTGSNAGAWRQFLITAGGALFDAKTGDYTWNCEGLDYKIHIGADFWSMEVFVPVKAFPNAVQPGTGVSWYGQVCRHRISDKVGGRENQKMNAMAGGFNSNTGDFAPIKFVE